ncbi:MAG: hypothetical protein LAT68_01060 [Cyclobacteriaceae bacterium]|nr:hypothetical protein [Cyclobacteriaceae bacterium]MCH8514892.1 hypothetical protein [Cyclobacteriaceae bacterium]
MGYNFKHTDLIRAYLDGELSKEQIADLKKELDTNEQLRQEFLYERDIVDAIKHQRKAALKARLNNVPVPPSVSINPLSPFFKGLVVGISSIILVAFSYFSFQLLTSDIDPEEVNTVIMTPESSSLTNNWNADSQLNLQSNEKEEIVAESTSSVIEDSTDKGLGQITDEGDMSAVSESQIIKPDETSFAVALPDVVDPDYNEVIPVVEDISAPENLIANDQLGKEVELSIDVESFQHNDYLFHYKFYQNKLYLYGDFSSSPYDLVEFKLSGSRTLFLVFEEQVYKIEDNKLDVTELAPTTNEEIKEAILSVTNKR